MIYKICLSAYTHKYANEIKQTLGTIDDMTYAREVPETDLYNCVCLYFQFDSIRIFLGWFELVSLISKYFIYFAATYVFLTRYSNAGAGYTFYPLLYWYRHWCETYSLLFVNSLCVKISIKVFCCCCCCCTVDKAQSDKNGSSISRGTNNVSYRHLYNSSMASREKNTICA